MAAIVHYDKAKKAIKKIKEAMQDYPLGIEFGELMQKTGYAKSSLYNALSLLGAHKSVDGPWHLPGSQNVVAPVNESGEDDLDDLATAIDQPVKQDDGGNMQDAPVNIEDEELNTAAPQISSPDNESSYPGNGEGALINPSAEIFNPSAGVVNPSDIVSIDDLHPEFAQLPDYQSSNSQAIHPEFLGGDEVYVLNAGSPYIHEIDWVENNQLGTVHFKDSMDSRSQKWLLPATKENHAKLCDLMPWIEWQRPELVGSDLMLEILEDEEVWLCQVGDDGDENCTASDIRLVTGYTEGQGFHTLGFGSLSFKNAVPVNVHGAPLTASDVFGAA